VSESDPHPHTDPKTAPDHELTPMETFFDNLFNEHMVAPQPAEAPPLIKGVEDHDQAQGGDGADLD